MTAVGVNPATFTTDNLMVQHAIEHSSDYKRGQIKTIRIITLEEEVTVGRNLPKEAMDAGTDADIAEPAITDGSTQTSLDEAIVPAGSENTVSDNTKPEVEVVSVTCLADARMVLEDRFGIDPSQVRTTVQIRSVAAANGIVFEGI